MNSKTKVVGWNNGIFRQTGEKPVSVYDEDYVSSIRAMRSDGEDAMLAGHARVVDATVKSLKPLVDELRRRRLLIGADLEL